ncbi:hypothetical protein FZC33_17535 [Labrys sp. KNU-23]|uniref:hypothetical protein n=1 Tax=Labrys sp. KNU-23 TaxID=2789216 RepID=UPI0011EF4575|nr:hypothetical protein [Labrys sp. KNU-23]QEN88002.1 hypothetical protein FZC33_17535 [Labrys sp. KNU-23]
MYSSFSAPVPPRDFHDRIYAGEIARFAGLSPMQALVAFTRSLLEEAFYPHQPAEIHRHLGHDRQVEEFSRLQKAFVQSAEVKRLWGEVFATLGLDPEKLARDRLHLRFQPHQAPAANLPRARSTATIAFHRDTWGSNLYAQTNWWAPIYPITAGRTFAIYPDLWTRAVPNTSASFDLEAVLARAKIAGRHAVDADDAIPHLSGAVDVGVVEPVVIEPGEVIAFSSAHAHAGVPNSTDFTRISLETRTLWIEDVVAGRGAPNVDGDAPWMAPGWFRRVSDGASLTEILGLNALEPYRRERPVA